VATRTVTRGELEIFSPLLEKCVGNNLKILDIVKKIGPLSENSSPFLVSQAGYGPGGNSVLNLPGCRDKLRNLRADCSTVLLHCVTITW